MATTTASITLSSSDLTGDALSLSSTATLTKAAAATGLDQTSGVARKIYTQSNVDTVFLAASYDDDKAHKIYMRNPSTVQGENFKITIGSQDVGKIYGGDWTFLPWMGDADVKITPSVATTMVLEYMIIFE